MQPFTIDSIRGVDSKIRVTRGEGKKKPSYCEKCCRPTALLCSSLRAHFSFSNQAPRVLGKISSSRIDITTYTDVIDTRTDVFIPRTTFSFVRTTRDVPAPVQRCEHLALLHIQAIPHMPLMRLRGGRVDDLGVQGAVHEMLAKARPNSSWQEASASANLPLHFIYHNMYTYYMYYITTYIHTTYMLHIVALMHSQNATSLGILRLLSVFLQASTKGGHKYIYIKVSAYY